MVRAVGPRRTRYGMSWAVGPGWYGIGPLALCDGWGGKWGSWAGHRGFPRRSGASGTALKNLRNGRVVDGPRRERKEQMKGGVEREGRRLLIRVRSM